VTEANPFPFGHPSEVRDEGFRAAYRMVSMEENPYRSDADADHHCREAADWWDRGWRKATEEKLFAAMHGQV